MRYLDGHTHCEARLSKFVHAKDWPDLAWRECLLIIVLCTLMLSLPIFGIFLIKV
jgi:hypothetical protein